MEIHKGYLLTVRYVGLGYFSMSNIDIVFGGKSEIIK